MRGNPVRKQVLVISAAALIIAVGVVAWYVLTQLQVGSMLNEGERTNLLLISHSAEGSAESLTLVSLAQEDLVFVTIPVDVRVKGPDGALAPASSVYAEFGAASATHTIANLLGMDVPFYLSAGRSLLTEWIDAFGGVVIQVENAAVYSDTSVEPPVRIEIREGEQLLDGAGALTFASAPGLADDAGLDVRQQALLRALLEQGVRAQEMSALRPAVRSAFPDLETNCSLGDLLELASLFHDVADSEVRVLSLPTEARIVGEDEVVDPKIVEAERLVASALRGLDLLTPDEVNIAVFNGNGVREMASRTAAYLRARGFSITRIGNADAFDYSPTYIVVLTDEAKAWVLQDALPPNEIRIVFPETFEASYAALRDYIPAGTDVLLIAGIGMELE